MGELGLGRFDLISDPVPHFLVPIFAPGESQTFFQPNPMLLETGSFTSDLLRSWSPRMEFGADIGSDGDDENKKDGEGFRHGVFHF